MTETVGCPVGVNFCPSVKLPGVGMKVTCGGASVELRSMLLPVPVPDLHISKSPVQVAWTCGSAQKRHWELLVPHCLLNTRCA